MKPLFDGQEVRARFAPGAPGRDAVIVTFAARQAEQSLDRAGFAEPFLERASLPAIHITVAWNHWYIVPEMAPALAAVREAAAPFARRVAYGSSMGGYGALLHSRAMGATRVVAVSPRFSIDPAKVPFHRQHREEAARLDFGGDDMEGGLSADAMLILAGDTGHLDAGHLALIRAASGGRARLLPLPFAGHPAAPFLQETRLLRETTRALLLDAEPDLAALRRRVRGVRGASASYWEAMSRRALRTGRDALALRAATEAVAREPARSGCAAVAADALWRAGRHDEALRELRRAAALAECDQVALESLAHTCAAAAGPIAALEAAIGTAPPAPGLASLLALLRRQQARRRPA